MIPGGCCEGDHLNLQELAIRELVEGDPERAAKKIVALATGVTRPQAAGVFALVDRRPRLMTSVGLDQNDLTWVQALAGDSRRRLERGQHVTGEGATSLPLIRPGGTELVGALYIRGATNQDAVATTMKPVCSMLA